jgi:hypothetical protein
MLTKAVSGRVAASAVHVPNAVNVPSAASKRAATANSSQSTVTDQLTLGSALKLGQTGRDKDRREREDLEAKPPWDLLPYQRDPSAGTSSILADRSLILSRLS